MDPLFFRNKILMWYTSGKRDLPWRSTNDPYKIWISEVILQQTRIDQGTSYYHRFIEKFPTVEQLAAADEDEILKIWQGLGYYSRARNLHSGAKQIINSFNGKFPNTSEKLKQIKGIGPYTSAAIASIVFNEPVAAIDGNVYRVLSRVFGIDAAIDSSYGQKIFSALANELINTKHPGDHNQAVMEFGALQCKPQNPDCTNCIFRDECMAFYSNKIKELPVKLKKTKVTKRYFNYLVIEQNDDIYINKRGQNDIWKNLYDFPVIETTKPTELLELMETKEWQSIFGDFNINVLSVSNEKIHVLSHQKIHALFITISLLSQKNLPSNFIKTNKRNIFELAVPKIIENYFSGIH